MATRSMDRVLASLTPQTPNFSAANQLFASGSNQISQGLQGLQNVAQGQADAQQAQYENQVEQNTQDAISLLTREARAAANRGEDPSAIDTENLLRQYGRNIDMGQINEAQQSLPAQLNQEMQLAQNIQTQTNTTSATKFVSDNYTRTENGSVNAIDFMKKLESDESLTPGAKAIARQQFAAQAQVDNGLIPQWSPAVTQQFGGSTVMTQTNNVTGETKQVGAWTDPSLNTGSGGQVFAADVQYRDADGNIRYGSKGKDGRLYDRNGAVLPVGGENGVEELGSDITSYHLDVVKNPENYTSEQVQGSRNYLNQQSILESNRGQLSQSQFVDHVTEINQSDSDIAYLDDSLQVVSLLMEQDASRLGSSARSWLNKYLEAVGMESGDEAINDLFAQSESRKLEVVRSIVRAFAPVSDTAMNLVMDGLSGRTLAQTQQALKATYDKQVSDHNAKVKTATDLGVAEQYRGTTHERWTRPTYESKAEVEAQTDQAVGAAPVQTPQPTPEPQQQFQEGMTATNPQTGQRMIFRNGQWESM